MNIRPFICLLSAAAALLLAGACEDHRGDNLDEFSTMVYFRNGGEQSLTLFRTGEDGLYRIPVCKAGSKLNGTATAVVIPFDEAQMSMYNTRYETSYSLIPQELYSFVDENRNPLPEQAKVDLEFGSGDSYKVVLLGIRTVDLSALMEANPDKEYVLGLQVFAQERVSDDINLIVLKPGIEVPYLSFVSPGVESHSYTSASPTKATYHNTVSLNMEENLWDFNCTIAPAGAEWLADYNNANGKNYELLPSSAYKLSTTDIKFEKGALEGSFDVEVSRESMDMMREYALPILITSCSKSEFSIDKDKNLYLLNVRLDPDEITITGDMVSVSHNQSGDGDGAPALVDGNDATYWHSPWSSNVNDPDPVYGIYVDIALKSPLKAIVLSYETRAGNNNGVPTHVVVGVSNDGSSWTVVDGGDVANEEMAGAAAGQWIELPVMKHSSTFKYIRLGIAESKAGDLRVPASGAYTALAEIRLKGTDN